MFDAIEGEFSNADGTMNVVITPHYDLGCFNVRCQYKIGLANFYVSGTTQFSSTNEFYSIKFEDNGYSGYIKKLKIEDSFITFTLYDEDYYCSKIK